MNCTDQVANVEGLVESSLPERVAAIACEKDSFLDKAAESCDLVLPCIGGGGAAMVEVAPFSHGAHTQLVIRRGCSCSSAGSPNQGWHSECRPARMMLCPKAAQLWGLRMEERS